VFWLCRAQVQTTVFTADGQRWSLVELLTAQAANRLDLSICLGMTERLPARLIAFRLDPQAAARRRRQVEHTARRKGRPASPERLALCAWDVSVTNLPADQLTPEESRVLLRARWQIELLFKLWKSGSQVDQSRSLKPYRILAELYAKLIGVVIQHWCIVLGCWEELERSMTKAARIVRENAVSLARGMRSRRHLATALRQVLTDMPGHCRVNTRKAKPNHCQLIQNPALAT
jgi:hypothetical protein